MANATEFLRKHIANYFFLKWVPFLLAILGIFYGLWEAIPVGKSWDAITLHEAVRIATEGAAWAILFFIMADKLVDYHLEAQRVEHSDRQLSEVEVAVGEVSENIKDKLQDFSQEIRLRFQQLEQITAGDVGGVVCLGHPSEAIGRISSNIPDAINIWNVRASFGDEDTFKYSGPDESMAVDAIRRFLSRSNCRWVDIIGPEDATSTDERMDKVFSNERETQTFRDRYTCFCLYRRIPVINFIALDYGGTRGKEVYFGFGRHKYDQIGNVFYSCNNLIADMFISLHNSLREDGLSHRYYLGAYSHNKSFIYGLWRSVAVNNGKIKNVAYINIEGNPASSRISGYVFSSNGVITGWFKSSEVLMLEDKLIYIYYRVNTESITTDEKAIAVYDFGDGATFIGKFLEVRTDHAINIYGSKASKDEFAMFDTKDWEKAPKIIDSHARSDYRVKAILNEISECGNELNIGRNP